MIQFRTKLQNFAYITQNNLLNEGTLCLLYHETILTNAIFFSDLRCLILMMQHRELHD